jgi:hypothetical protein
MERMTGARQEIPEKRGLFFSVFLFFIGKSMGWTDGLHVACKIERQGFLP